MFGRSVFQRILQTMEIEVKIRLPNAEAHSKVLELLRNEGKDRGLKKQVNTFFDSNSRKL